MAIRELLDIVAKTARDKGYSQPFIVGGIPRDKLLGKLGDIEDVDITTGDDTVHALAKDVGALIPNGSYKVLSDGHAQITVGSTKLDFSSNYRVPGLEKTLQKVGVKPEDMMVELLSRDFTCNALLMELDLETIKDPTGLGIPDIRKKLLRTCLPSHVTLGNDNKRVVRILYLAAKLGFEVDDEIINWVKRHPESIANVKPKYLTDKLKKAFDYDSQKTVKLIHGMGIGQYVPMTESITDEIGSQDIARMAQVETPNITIQPGRAEATAALDILKLWKPNYFIGVREIVIGPSANYGYVEAGPGKDPTVIYINADRIVAESGGQQSGQSAALACARVIAHEKGHVESYDDQQGFVGGEAPAEAQEQEFDAWVNGGGMQQIQSLPSFTNLNVAASSVRMRQLERLSHLHTMGYYQGTEKPTPGKPQYKKPKKTDKERVDESVRKHVLFQNYDYTSEGPNETSPGGSPYYGTPGGGEKSMKDWIDKRRGKKSSGAL